MSTQNRTKFVNDTNIWKFFHPVVSNIWQTHWLCQGLLYNHHYYAIPKGEASLGVLVPLSVCCCCLWSYFEIRDAWLIQLCSRGRRSIE